MCVAWPLHSEELLRRSKAFIQKQKFPDLFEFSAQKDFNEQLTQKVARALEFSVSHGLKNHELLFLVHYLRRLLEFCDEREYQLIFENTEI